MRLGETHSHSGADEQEQVRVEKLLLCGTEEVIIIQSRIR
jgi:hypothetical protein